VQTHSFALDTRPGGTLYLLGVVVGALVNTEFFFSKPLLLQKESTTLGASWVSVFVTGVRERVNIFCDSRQHSREHL